jgi:RND family efflux transporter MFP subunit
MRPAQLQLPGALLCFGVLAACQYSADPAAKVERLSRPVQVERVFFESERSTREFVGVVRARYETDLGFRVAGKIIDRLVNVGDRVRTGDIVARLDAGDFELQVASAQAELLAATSSLTEASSEEVRYGRLKAHGYAAPADFDRKHAAKDEAEGRLERARRMLDLARNQLTYADLKSDSDGVITALSAEAGQVVAVGQAVVRLARQGEKEAVIALPETSVGNAGEAIAAVRLWSNPGRTFAARLRELSPQADPTTRTYAARFTIEEADDSVALGMTAAVSLSHPGEIKVVRLPLAAVLNRGNGPAVYVVDGNEVLQLRPVALASFSQDQALVASGILEGEKVVTLGVQKLQAGLKVRTVETR